MSKPNLCSDCGREPVFNDYWHTVEWGFPERKHISEYTCPTCHKTFNGRIQKEAREKWDAKNPKQEGTIKPKYPPTRPFFGAFYSGNPITDTD